MTPSNEKFISQFIKNQFPSFYNEEGELFVEFVKCYYEWLETENNELNSTRSFIDAQDIDTTPASFFKHFENKYLYGLPEETLINRKLLIKHIKDVYKSKGTIRGWKLLFRLLFNEDLDIYFPSRDILAPSEGTWIEPIYLEVTDNGNLNDYLGKKIIGASSGTTALVESVVYEPINQNIVSILYLSKISPMNADFIRGEKIILEENKNTTDISNAATIIGSLSSIEISSGGQNFEVGNILRIVHKDPYTNEILTTGVESEIRVTKISKGIGSIYYEIKAGGSGFSYNPVIVQYNDELDITGKNAKFEIGPLTNIQYYTYSNDILINDLTTLLNANNYHFVGNPSANLSTPIIDTLTFETKPYGKISTLTNIATGNSYTKPLKIFVKEGLRVGPLVGKSSFTTNTNIITGNNTTFTTYLANNDFIAIAPNGNTSNVQNHVIKRVVNNTSLELHGPITLPSNSNSNIYFYINPHVINLNENEYTDSDGSIKGENANITGIPSIGKGIVAEAIAINSGKGYHQDEEVKLYLYGSIKQPVIDNPGSGYANGDILILNGGSTKYKAAGTITTNSNGSITSINMSSFGSSYKSVPIITIQTKRGSGATITTELGDFNTYTIVTGKTKLGGLGRGRGRWTSTKSFLNSDKKIQDSYFYQSYSYQLRSPINMTKYKDMLETIYHVSGYELFGEPYLVKNIKNNFNIGSESGIVIS